MVKQKNFYFSFVYIFVMHACVRMCVGQRLTLGIVPQYRNHLVFLKQDISLAEVH